MILKELYHELNSRLLYKDLMHNKHKNEEDKQIERKQCDRDMICDQTEEGRHRAGAYIRTCHLNPYYGLRLVGAEMRRSGMDYAGVYRCAAQSDCNKTRQ